MVLGPTRVCKTKTRTTTRAGGLSRPDDNVAWPAWLSHRRRTPRSLGVGRSAERSDDAARPSRALVRISARDPIGGAGELLHSAYAGRLTDSAAVKERPALLLFADGVCYLASVLLELVILGLWIMLPTRVVSREIFGYVRLGSLCLNQVRG